MNICPVEGESAWFLWAEELCVYLGLHTCHGIINQQLFCLGRAGILLSLSTAGVSLISINLHTLLTIWKLLEYSWTRQMWLIEL